MSLLVLGACACSGGANQPVAPSDAGSESGRDAGPGCSRELCFPYTCDVSWGVCRTQCFQAAHCLEGFSCEATVCLGAQCTPATARDRCGPYACERGLCAKNCSQSGCADGYYCRGDTNECVPRCTTREDAVCNGYLCDLDVQECEPICFAGGLGCATGFRCDERGMCVPCSATVSCPSTG